MPVVSQLNCPHCGKLLTTTRAIPPGSRVRCKKCSNCFEVVETGGFLLESLAVGESLPRRQPGYSGIDPLPPLTQAPAAAAPEAPKGAGRRRKDATRAAKGTAWEGGRHSVVVVLALCLVGAVALFVNWYAHTVKQLSVEAAVASARRTGKYQAAAKAAPAPKPAPSPYALDWDPERAVAPASQQHGDLVVAVSDATLGPVKMLRSKGDEVDRLALVLRVTNVGARPFHYRSWALGLKPLMLHDQFKIYYNQVQFRLDDPPQGHTAESVIEPGRTATDLLVFESPANAINRSFYLDLPHPADPERLYKFLVQASLVRRTFTMAMEAPKVMNPLPQPAPPPEPVPYDPAQDPRVRSAVITEFRELWRSVERQAKGMGFDRARRHRTQGRTTAIQRIAEKFELPEVTVRQILVGY